MAPLVHTAPISDEVNFRACRSCNTDATRGRHARIHSDPKLKGAAVARCMVSVMFIVILTACTSTLPTARSTPVHHPGLYVDAGERLGPISPNVFGSNTGPWAYFAPKERELFK